MGISLEKVELENFRSHKFLVFEPEEEGVTAISGPNGAGKSTIVDGISWALYGVKPKGVSRAADFVRKGSSPGKDKIAVRVVLQIDSERFLIERRIVNKNGAVECEIWALDEGQTSAPSKNIAGPAVSAAEPEIRRRLGLNSKSFLAAVFVQQKQVDELILGGPKNRTEVIERLTGIDSITSAYQMVREEYNSLRKMIGSVAEIEDSGVLKKELEELNAQTDALKSKYIKTKQKLEDNKESATKTSSELQLAKIAREKERDLKQRAAEANAALSEIEESLNETLEEREKAKQEAGNCKSEDYSSRAKELEALEKEFNSTKATAAVLKDSIQRSKEVKETNSRFIERSKTTSISEAKDLLSSLQKALASVKEKQTKELKAAAANASLVKSFETAINVLREGECPTCLQKVSDADTAVRDLEGKIVALKNENTPDRNKEIANLERKILAYKKVVECFESSEELEKQQKEEAAELLLLEGKMKELDGEVSRARKSYDRAARSKELVERYKAVSSRARRLVSRKNSLGDLLKGISEDLKGVDSLSNKAYNSLSLKDEKLSKTVGLLEIETVKLNGEIQLLEEKKRALESNLKTAEKAERDYKQLLRDFEASSASATLLEEFRVNRINTSIPLIESYASDLLNRFTEGAFSGIKLDAKFNAEVLLPDGSTRPIGLLSGGELSAAAIALRLAISMLLNSESSNGLLILDEVLVSQDKNRAEIVLNTIAEVCKGQVVIIAHNDSIDGIADKVVSIG